MPPVSLSRYVPTTLQARSRHEDNAIAHWCSVLRASTKNKAKRQCGIIITPAHRPSRAGVNLLLCAILRQGFSTTTDRLMGLISVIIPIVLRREGTHSVSIVALRILTPSSMSPASAFTQGMHLWMFMLLCRLQRILRCKQILRMKPHRSANVISTGALPTEVAAPAAEQAGHPMTPANSTVTVQEYYSAGSRTTTNEQQGVRWMARSTEFLRTTANRGASGVDRVLDGLGIPLLHSETTEAPRFAPMQGPRLLRRRWLCTFLQRGTATGPEAT